MLPLRGEPFLKVKDMTTLTYEKLLEAKKLLEEMEIPEPRKIWIGLTTYEFLRKEDPGSFPDISDYKLPVKIGQITVFPDNPLIENPLDFCFKVDESKLFPKFELRMPTWNIPLVKESPQKK